MEVKWWRTARNANKLHTDSLSHTLTHTHTHTSVNKLHYVTKLRRHTSSKLCDTAIRAWSTRDDSPNSDKTIAHYFRSCTIQYTFHGITAINFYFDTARSNNTKLIFLLTHPEKTNLNSFWHEHELKRPHTLLSADKGNFFPAIFLR